MGVNMRPVWCSIARASGRSISGDVWHRDIAATYMAGETGISNNAIARAGARDAWRTCGGIMGDNKKRRAKRDGRGIGAQNRANAAPSRRSYAPVKRCEQGGALSRFQTLSALAHHIMAW